MSAVTAIPPAVQHVVDMVRGLPRWVVEHRARSVVITTPDGDYFSLPTRGDVSEAKVAQIIAEKGLRDEFLALVEKTSASKRAKRLADANAEYADRLNEVPVHDPVAALEPEVPKEEPQQAQEEYPCPECGKSFAAPSARGSHLSKTHGIAGSNTKRRVPQPRQKAVEMPAGVSTALEMLGEEMLKALSSSVDTSAVEELEKKVADLEAKLKESRAQARRSSDLEDKLRDARAEVRDLKKFYKAAEDAVRSQPPVQVVAALLKAGGQGFAVATAENG